MTIVSLRQVGRDFPVGDQIVHALDDVCLEIEAGDYISIMGASGSGKSTLLNSIGLLDRPTRGQYYLDGQDVSGLGERELAVRRNRHIGFVFQMFHLIPRMSAAENIELPLILAGIRPDERRQRVANILERLHPEGRARHRPRELSGGQRQRVAIARATIMSPTLLLADEPTGNLDHRAGEEVIEILEELNSEGITLIIVTHDPALGRRARRRLRMFDGRLLDPSGAVMP